MIDNKLKILLVEDNPGDARLIGEMLKSNGNNHYIINSVDSLYDGLESLKKETFDLVLLDLVLPDCRGFMTLEKILPYTQDIAVIVLTGLADEKIAIQAIHHGAQDYLIKGQVNASLLTRSMRYAVERKKAEKEIKTSYNKLKRVFEETVEALSSVLAQRDPSTQNHQRHVTKLAYAIAAKMELSQDKIKGLQLAGLLHDIGKISIPAEILMKPNRLTDAEYRIVKTHSKIAYDILKKVEFPWPIADIVLQHHERLDGSGYPQGLKNGEILLEARIIAVADVVEAMSSHRPYRPAPGLDKALGEIKKNRERLYDPTVVDTCICLFADKKFDFQND
ncbi:HD domain-containing protein [candidate division WOR-3 bacterium]|nr:HD domain-containing protein [candidate division WOR-3 bacterium]